MITLGLIPSLGWQELILVLVIVLIIFGPGKLPEIGKAIGKGLNEFKQASTSVKKELDEAIKEEEKK